MRSAGSLIAPSLIGLLLTASTANAQSTVTVPCSRVEEFLRGEIDVPPGAKAVVSAVTLRQLVARVGGPENFAALMRTPEGRAAIQAKQPISDEEFEWCKQRVQNELLRRQREKSQAERPVGPFASERQPASRPDAPVGGFVTIYDACVREANAAGPEYSEAWKQRFASCLDARAPRAAPSPPGQAPAAPLAVIPITSGQPKYVDVRINDATPARLILDTGADRTTIAPRVLRAAGLVPRGSATLRGVTGHATADVYEIASLEVGGARVGRLTVFAHDTGEPGIDGLLGRDFLDHFKYTIDNTAGRVTLSPK